MLKRFLIVLIYMCSPLWICIGVILAFSYMIITMIPLFFMNLITAPIYYIITRIKPQEQHIFDKYVECVCKPLEYLDSIK